MNMLELEKFHLQTGMKASVETQKATKEYGVNKEIKQNQNLLYSYANKRRTFVSPIHPLIVDNRIHRHNAKEMEEVMQKQNILSLMTN